MRFAFFSVLALQAAKLSHAVLLEAQEEPALSNGLAQLNAFIEAESENANLVDALTKVISSLQTVNPTQATGAAQTQAGFGMA